MNIPERIDDPLEGVRSVVEGRIADLQTVMPGFIVSYDPVRQTATVQPAVQGKQTLPSGEVQPITLPQLLDVPVHFASGGGMTLTFPIKPGDECSVHFASRDFSAWWQSGGVQAPIEPRMHDLSDAICQVGIRSQVKNLPGGAHSTNVELRSDDGSRKISIDPGGDISITSAGDIAITATGNIDLKSATLTHNGKNIGDIHKHTQVQQGGAQSGPPA